MYSKYKAYDSSALNVSFAYLRSLEIKEINGEDMPVV
jgi:hypothetical protein